MLHDFSTHHTQRGNITAVVWGEPGARPSLPRESEATETTIRIVDAEELTRGRRATTPFVQQCDLIFSLPDSIGGVGGNDEMEGSREVEEELPAETERRAKAFVTEALGESFYYRARGPLSALLEEPFLTSFVLKGNFSTLALNAASDQGNSFAILPGGTLVLSLDRESFQTLGLPGEAAPIRPKGNSKRAGAGAGCTGGGVGVEGGGAGGSDRYVSVVDLSSKAFRSGKPLRDRVLSCLGGGGGEEGAKKGADVDMVVCWWGDGDDGGGGGGVQSEGSGEKRASYVAAAGSRDGGSRDDVKGEGRGGRERGRQQQQQQQQHRCCRRVTFPVEFSAEKIDLVPEVTFFRDTCCPDLDLVGQGLASPPLLETPASQQESPTEGAGCQAPGSTKCLLMLDLFEWLGAASCGLEAQLRREPWPPEPYLSEFETPRHLRFRRHRTLCRARLRGFLPPPTVERCVKAAGARAAGERTVLSPAGQERGTTGLFLTHGNAPDGCSWASVTAWPFRDAPRAYAGADAPCAGGERSKKRGGGKAVPRVAKEWPVGGHGVYTIVACPGETAVACCSASCPGPGW